MRGGQALDRIGRYVITRLLGQGGMGVVYAAHDERLDRPVAIKVVRPEALGSDDARERFRREARAAARVSHPNICPLYEFDEDGGKPYLVMELLDGEPLAARLDRGPIPLGESLGIAAAMLDALAALHRRNVVHRDLKPANIFLTPHGLKLLDFGLAQPLATDEHTRELALTGANVILGTPQYMAPEQLFEGRVDERADLFAASAIIYEMLAGRPAFPGPTITAVLHAVGYLEPPALEGSPEIVAVDRVLREGMAKKPADRTARADLLAAGLRDAVAAPDPKPRSTRRTRFVALPLRVLRPDPDTDFLAYSVPDAVSVALATLDSVIVRSPQATPGVDVRTVGRELSVDVVLTGTLLRAGADVRVSAQLADAAAGTLLWSDVAQAPIADLFQLQDTLTERIVSSLSLPLTARDRQSLDRHAPSSADAYAMYLRANELARDPARMHEARELYEQALALDPEYAPAWAALGRARRVIAKWGGQAGAGLMPQAEAAFRRAFDLDPDLSMAHDLAAYVDCELGRAREAMERLLPRARARRGDAGVLAGLVTTCRYAGLLDASKAAHQRAAIVDPARLTSVPWTHFMLGDYDAAIAADKGMPPFCTLLSEVLDGRRGTERIRQAEAAAWAPGAQMGIGAYRAIFEQKFDEAGGLLRELQASGFDDPEGWYLYGVCYAHVGAESPAVEYLTRAVEGGYACHEALTHRREWVSMSHPALPALVARTAELVADARARFDALDGVGVLSAESSPSSKVPREQPRRPG